MRACGRALQPRVDDHTKRLPLGGHQPHVQPRVVLQHRAGTGEQRTGTAAPGMTIAASGLAGDPLAFAAGQRRLAVQRRRDLHSHPGPAPGHAREEADVEFSRVTAMAPAAVSTAMPAARNPAMPAPATSGFGSIVATTTRDSLASIKASQQGGVRPWCEQGSSVTQAVPPATWQAPAAACLRAARPPRHVPSRPSRRALTD